MIASTKKNQAQPFADAQALSDDQDRWQEITPVVTEVEPDDTAAQAQLVSRSLFNVSPNPNLPRDTLPSVTINGSIGTNLDQDYYRIDLVAGELLIVDIDGTTTGLDSFIKVFFQGNFLIENDDRGTPDAGSSTPGFPHNVDSYLQYRVPFTGTYYVAVSSFEAGSSGAYSLNLSIGPQVTMAEVHEENIQAMISGARWSGTTVTYGFPTAASQYGTSGAKEIAVGFSPLTATQIGVVQQQLAAISGVTSLTFVQETANPGNAQMRYALSPEPATAHAYYPGAGNGGDSWYNDTKFNSPVVGNYAYMVFLHETGHALGLEHGHEAPTPLSGLQDSLEYSVMTYRSFVGQDPQGYRNETFGYPQTLMMYDIAALQRVYGANFNTNSGNSVYTWDASTGAFSINGAVQHTPGANRVFMTVWDGGGTDTYDLSNYSNGVTVDLRPGEWSTTSAVQLANLGRTVSPTPMARGNVANALLYNGDTRSLIENAIGGAGNDRLFGNQANNLLDGGLGDDTLFLDGGGNDDARGGAGDDILYYGGELTAADLNDGGQGTDTLVLQGNYSLTLGSASVVGIEGISLQSGSITTWGQSGTNSYDYSLVTLDSNIGAGQQFRINGQSLLVGEDFSLNGAAETDGMFFVYSGFGVDRLTGGAQGDVFFFEAGRFGAGDVINGGAGGDAVVISGTPAGQNVLAVTIEAGTFVDIEALSFNGRFASNPGARPSYEVVLKDGNIAPGGNLIINANSFSSTQSLSFDGSAVQQGGLSIFGGVGSDILKGGANADLMYAEGGSDVLTGGGGADIFQYRSVSDSALGSSDRILDFLRGADRIDLSRIDANNATAGDDGFTFIGNSAFSGTAGELHSVASGSGSWFVEGDVNGDGIADFRIEVFTPGDANPLTTADFFL